MGPQGPALVNSHENEFLRGGHMPGMDHAGGDNAAICNDSGVDLTASVLNPKLALFCSTLHSELRIHKDTGNL
jgi:hypothetical protein